MQPKLFEYGIQLEKSDIRVHVSPATRRLYVFPTVEAQNLLNARPDDYREALAYQTSVSYATASGRLVPCNDIPRLRAIHLEACALWDQFNSEDDTSKKGKMAVEVVRWALREGRLPLWAPYSEETKACVVQQSGVDILLVAKWRIQVKCDWFAGPKKWGGTGNLYLQQKELNPRKRH